ncbi:MAG TPA: hypothetical protein VNW92_16845, partial [Polyangiaceae bacterium]|nr:hypothetical protein [Polyangiaceae bacterium]
SLSSIEGAFAPTGYAYFYYDAQTPMYSPRYARVTQSGSTPVALLPAGATTLTFDTSGTLLFYALGSYPAGYKLYVLSLADGQARELSIVQDGEVFDGFEIVPAPGNSVIVEIRKLADDQTFLRRVSLDANQAGTTITNPAVSAAYIFGSDDPNLLLVTNSDNSLDFIRLEPYARSTLPGTFEFSVDPNTYGIVGHHAYYLANDVLHLVQYDDAGALQDIAISAAGEKAVPCTGRFTYTPQQKLAFVQGDGAELVFVDLTTSPPAAVGSFSSSATGYKVGCPHWGDSDTALLFGETNGTNGNTYITRWNAAAPEQPKLITQAIGGVLAFMYR